MTGSTVRRLLAVAALVLAPLAVLSPAGAAGGTPQTVTITSDAPTGDAAIFDRVNGLGSYVPTGTSTSGLPVYFSVTSPDDACFSLPGSVGDPNGVGVITIYWNSPGVCVVHANQPGDEQYAAAPEVTQTVTVLGETTHLTAKAAKGLLGSAPTTFTATLQQDFAFGPGVGRGPVPGATVRFSVGGTFMCSAVTSSTGVATCKKPIGFQKWVTAKTFTASYAGSQFLQPTSTTTRFG